MPDKGDNCGVPVDKCMCCLDFLVMVGVAGALISDGRDHNIPADEVVCYALCDKCAYDIDHDSTEAREAWEKAHIGVIEQNIACFAAHHREREEAGR